MKSLLISIVMLLGSSAFANSYIGHCTQDEPLCVAEGLIQKLGDESYDVNKRRLIRKMYNQCGSYNAKCAGRFVFRAINQAMGKGGGGGGHHPGGQYDVTIDEITNNNYVRTAWCEPGDYLISGSCPGKYDKNWVKLNKKVTRGKGRYTQEGYQCNNHRKNIHKYKAVAKCQRK